MWDNPNRIMPATNTQLADSIRNYIIGQMSRDYPALKYDQWLAMDVIDLSLSYRANYDLYMKEFMIEFDLKVEPNITPNSAIINSIFVMSQFISDNTERETNEHELAQSIIELIDRYDAD